MRQVVQSVRSGELRVVDVPSPIIGPTQVLVATSHSLLSAGTEKAVRELASASLLGKARARPDLVRQVARRAMAEGVQQTVKAVRRRLDDDMPLGYSAAGTVLEVGEAVWGIRPGQRVATGGAAHAEVQAVAANLAVPIPDGVSESDAAFATVAAIALHGLRLAELGAGGRLCVVGLGLVGQLAVRLGIAAGYQVVGIDRRRWTAARAQDAGALGLVEAGDDTTAAVLDWSRGRGADAILVTAATPSSDPMLRAPALARDRATVVVVGDVGLQLSRTPLYEKELTLRFARSYGPGRYDLEAFLDLCSNGRIEVADLVTHTFPIDDATSAYQLIQDGTEDYLGIQLTYPHAGARAAVGSRVVTVNERRAGGGGVGVLGAGNFARATLVPALKEAGFGRLAYVASASGVSARHLAVEAGFERATSNNQAVLDDPDVAAVFILTPHDTHARLATDALRAGKHVFCEKPLALTVEDLAEVATAWRAASGQLMVGFNRRYAPAVAEVRKRFSGGGGPLVLTYRVNAGSLPVSHWYNDRRQGGRLLGEVCHFIDTCGALVDAPVASVFAVGGGGGEALLANDVVVTLRYDDGSLATISYGSGGHRATPKERLEVLGRGHTAVVDDFRRVTVDEKEVFKAPADKGHGAELRAFRRAMLDGGGDITTPALATMAATLAAGRSLLTGLPEIPALP
jgi:2-desacetyl-2-hydroxyethyl bacteriochlorophyllide A dehydrogenase